MDVFPGPRPPNSPGQNRRAAAAARAAETRARNQSLRSHLSRLASILLTTAVSPDRIGPKGGMTDAGVRFQWIIASPAAENLLKTPFREWPRDGLARITAITEAGEIGVYVAGISFRRAVHIDKEMPVTRGDEPPEYTSQPPSEYEVASQNPAANGASDHHADSEQSPSRDVGYESWYSNASDGEETTTATAMEALEDAHTKDQGNATSAQGPVNQHSGTSERRMSTGSSSSSTSGIRSSAPPQWVSQKHNSTRLPNIRNCNENRPTTASGVTTPLQQASRNTGLPRSAPPAEPARSEAGAVGLLQHSVVNYGLIAQLTSELNERQTAYIALQEHVDGLNSIILKREKLLEERNVEIANLKVEVITEKNRENFVRSQLDLAETRVMQLQRENMKLSRNLRGIVKAVDMTLKSFEAENKKSLHQLAEEVSNLIIKSGNGNQTAIKSLSDDISKFKQMLATAGKASMMSAEDEN